MAWPYTGDVLYIHGWGFEEWGFTAEECPMYQQLRVLLAGTGLRLHAPNLHPDGNPKKTQIRAFLDEVHDLASTLPGGRFTAVIGWSFGGFLASVFQQERPESVGALLLCAPAIDNFLRNYDGVDPGDWSQPKAFVEALMALPPRPHIIVPTVLVHGMLDNDDGGSAPWRAQEWASNNQFAACYFPKAVDHCLENWLGGEESMDDVPPWRELVAWAIVTGYQSKQSSPPSLPSCAKEEGGANWEAMPTVSAW